MENPSQDLFPVGFYETLILYNWNFKIMQIVSLHKLCEMKQAWWWLYGSNIFLIALVLHERNSRVQFFVLMALVYIQGYVKYIVLT